jgi:hypothetical protein
MRLSAEEYRYARKPTSLQLQVLPKQAVEENLICFNALRANVRRSVH